MVKLKRVLDLLLAAVALVACSPLMAIVAALVASCIGRPVLFVQMRPGLHGRPFAMLKFRTMSMHRDSQGRLLADEQRMTRLGSLLRSTSLDELPELINVIRGEMSIVGPRPLLVSYLDRYSPEQARRHEVRPGITGWAQVNGRNQTDWQERLRMDTWYIDHWSLGLDLFIVLKTIGVVVAHKGVSAQGHATMPEFDGQCRDMKS